MSPTTLLADPALRIARPRPCVTSAGPAPEVRRRSALRARWFVLPALVALLSCGLLHLGTWPPLATVMSASMAPTINTGDMVVLQRLDRPVRRGDIVAVRVPDEARNRYGYPPVVIHRAVRIDRAGMLTTKGDGRKEADPFTVPATAPKTRVVATLPAAGQILGFLSSTLGLLWLAAGGLLFVGLPLADRYRNTRRLEQDDHARRLEEAVRDAANAREQLHVVTAALTAHLEELPARIETAVASAVAAVERDHRRAPDAAPARFVADLPPTEAEPPAPLVTAPAEPAEPVVLARAEPMTSAEISPATVVAPAGPVSPGVVVAAAPAWRLPAASAVPARAVPAARVVAASAMVAPAAPALVAASSWVPPTPDLMGVLAKPAKRFDRVVSPAAASWDALPLVLPSARRGPGGVLSA